MRKAKHAALLRLGPTEEQMTTVMVGVATGSAPVAVAQSQLAGAAAEVVRCGRMFAADAKVKKVLL